MLDWRAVSGFWEQIERIMPRCVASIRSIRSLESVDSEVSDLAIVSLQESWPGLRSLPGQRPQTAQPGALLGHEPGVLGEQGVGLGEGGARLVGPTEGE